MRFQAFIATYIRILCTWAIAQHQVVKILKPK